MAQPTALSFTSRVPRAVDAPRPPRHSFHLGLRVGVWLDLLRESFIMGKLLFFPGLVGCFWVLSIKFYWKATISMMCF